MALDLVSHYVILIPTVIVIISLGSSYLDLSPDPSLRKGGLGTSPFLVEHADRQPYTHTPESFTIISTVNIDIYIHIYIYIYVCHAMPVAHTIADIS